MNFLTKTCIVLTLCFSLVGCAGMHESKDYRRHSLSQLSVPLEGGSFFWFDVSLSPELPDGDSAAEAVRMEWLADWLETRKQCNNGFEIIERRAFTYLEHNPANYDLRYKVRCKA